MSLRRKLGLAAALTAALASLPISSKFQEPVIAARQKPGTTTLDDQVELAVTVYNSDIALVRDVQIHRLARGTSDLHFMDIAATVNPATVHFRSLTEPSRVSVLEQNYEYDLLEPDKLLRKYVGRTVTLVRRQNGVEEEVQAHLISYNNAPGLEDRQRDRDRHARRSHPLSGAARKPVFAADADLDARQRRHGASSRRGVVSGRPAGLERRLRADGRARRQGRGSRRLGHRSRTAAERRSGMPRCSWWPAT